MRTRTMRSPREQARYQEIFDRVREAGRVRRHAWRTHEAYAAAIWDYRCWLNGQRGRNFGSSEEKVRCYLSHIAQHCSAASQNQHLCALLFWYHACLGQKLGDLGVWARAQVPKRLPVWLTEREIDRLLPALPRAWQLAGRLCYGSGLRLMELMRLRVQDIDIDHGIIRVVAGKGDKDRNTILPRSLAPDIEAHLARIRPLWQADRRAKTPAVWTPEPVRRKYPNAGLEWPWFWFLPGSQLSRDPETGIIRRHHAAPSGFQKVLKRTADAVGIGKRVKVHSLRHSFATHLVEQGIALPKLQKLLGHSRLETTAIYLHCAPREINTVRSPLDDRTGQVIPFPGYESQKAQRDMAAV